jgi:hypothetical protein
MKIERSSYQMPEMSVGALKSQGDTSPAQPPEDGVQLTGAGKAQKKIDSSMLGKSAAAESSETAGPRTDETALPIGLFGAGTQTSAMIGGPQGTVIAAMSHDELLSSLEALKSKGFTFFREKTSWVPLLGGRKEISPEGAADILDKGSDKDRGSLSVKGQNLAFLPMQSTEDVREMQAFYLQGTSSQLPQGEMARLLADMEGLGYSFRAEGKDGMERIGTYGAYNILSGQWKEDAPFKGRILAESGGVTLAFLTEEKAKDPMKLRTELKEAKDAVSGLAQLNKGITSQELKMVGKSIGDTTFSERAGFFLELFKKEQKSELEDTVNSYRLVQKSSAGEREFRENAATMLRLYDELSSRETRDVQWSYNYIQENLKGKKDREEIFHRLLAATKDMNSSISGLQFIAAPGGSADIREKVFLALVEHEHDNEEAVKDFAVLEKNTKPGESIETASRELLDLMEHLDGKGRSARMARRGFMYLREELKDKPEQQKTFNAIFRESGDIQDTISAMEFLKNPLGSADAAAREEVFVSLLQNEKQVSDARDDFTFINDKMAKGEDFRSAGRLFSTLLGALKDQWNAGESARKAFTIIHTDYQNDPAVAGRFTTLLSAMKSVELAAEAYTALSKEISIGEYADREAALMSISKGTRDGREAIDSFKAVAGELGKGESLAAEAEHLSALGQSLSYNSSLRPIDAYRETKALFKDNPGGFADFLELATATKAYKETREAWELLQKPSGNEGYAERRELFGELLAKGAPLAPANSYEKITPDKVAAEAIMNYGTVSGHLDGGESLRDGASRFLSLMGVLAGQRRGEETRDAFAFIDSEVRKGSFPGKTAKEVTLELMKILLITDSLDSAKAQLLHPASGNSVIDVEDGFVDIGGVKIPVKRGQS